MSQTVGWSSTILHTHGPAALPAALYEAFPPHQAHQARAMLERLEFQYTPKHGSWLKRAMSAISVLARGCLSRLVGDLLTLRRRVSAW